MYALFTYFLIAIGNIIYLMLMQPEEFFKNYYNATMNATAVQESINASQSSTFLLGFAFSIYIYLMIIGGSFLIALRGMARDFDKIHYEPRWLRKARKLEPKIDKK